MASDTSGESSGVTAAVMPCGWRYIGPRRDSTRLWWGCNHCDVVEVGTKTAGVLLQPPCQRPKLRQEKELEQPPCWSDKPVATFGEPDLYYSPEKPDQSFDDPIDLLETVGTRTAFTLNRFCTLYQGPDRFAVRLPKPEGGEPDLTEWKWFNTQEEAEAAIVAAQRIYYSHRDSAEDREFENDLDSFWQYYCGEGVAIKRAVPRR